MLVRDWSSDVCSSDLRGDRVHANARRIFLRHVYRQPPREVVDGGFGGGVGHHSRQIGRCSFETGVQTCALPISGATAFTRMRGEYSCAMCTASHLVKFSMAALAEE